MITLAWYLLKVTICSGILCGYYYIALRDKVFHRWNRFYLLASVVLALAVPVMKINIFKNNAEENGTVIKMLQTINSGDEIIIEYSRHNGLQLNSDNIISAAYLLITIVFLTVFFLALYKISRLRRKYPEVKMKGINFISTDAKGTPFSFFKSVFWNNAIDLHSRQGQQIFNHEIAHVKEKHSYDKVFMNVVLIFFWMNPFFWLMRKEIGMIHEFIADKESLEDDDVNAFAEMILQTVYPGQNYSITNNFFHSPLKRRLLMFTKNKNPRVSYLSRLLVLPLAAIVFFAFTLKMKNPSRITYTGKALTVVIDAGHGGRDNGAMQNNINEKDLDLAIAKQIKELNSNKNLNIVLSRDQDVEINPKDRTNFAIRHNADLLISIHINADEKKNEHDGLDIVIPKNDNSYITQSKLLGSSLIEAFKNNYGLKVPDNLSQREKNVWILKANEYPAVLIELGYITTTKDLDYLIDPKNQKTIAQNILNGIEKYANEKIIGDNNASSIQIETNSLSSEDSLPDALYVVDGKIVSKNEAKAIDPNTIQSVNVLKGENAAKKYGEKGKAGVVEITKKSGNENSEPVIKPQPLYVINGKESSKDALSKISPASIESINVLKDERAVKNYGEKGKNGVVEIKLKNISTQVDSAPPPPPPHATDVSFSLEKDKVDVIYDNGHVETLSKEDAQKEGLLKRIVKNTSSDSIPDKVFTKVENEASFPGGQQAWIKYISRKIQASIDSFTNKDYGTCVVKFIVNTDGSISNVEATTMKDTYLADIALNAVKTGPKWIPATQNGRVVAAYRLQPITLTDPEKKE